MPTAPYGCFDWRTSTWIWAACRPTRCRVGFENVIKIFLMRRESPMSTTFYPSTSSRTVRLSYPLVHLCLVLGLAAIGCAADNSVPAAPQVTYWPVELAATEG